MSDLSESRGILASSAVMATGTVFSRASGYLRNLLLAAAIGNELHADLFNIGNTIPNMLYILLAGGVFNAVLVPQLVRARKNDPDGGEAYTNRVITLALIFLAAVTVLLVLAAPLVMKLYLNGAYDDPSLAAQRDSAITFARYCLPQVFFYGMFVLLGRRQRARPLRPHDVGADRQQRHLDRRPRAVPVLVRRPSTKATAARRTPAPRRWCSAAARPSGSWPRS